MSIDLIVEVLDHAPDTLTSGERLVLVVIAEWANDRTRIARQTRNWTLDTICRRAGIKRTGLKSVLQGLAKKGLDVRVPARWKDGKPVYAYEGAALTFKVPAFPQRGGCGISTELRGEAVASPLAPSGEATASERGGCGISEGRSQPLHSAPEGRPQPPPSPQKPPLINPSPSASINCEPDTAVIPEQREEGRVPQLQTRALAVIGESLAVTDPDAGPDDIRQAYAEVIRTAPRPPKSVRYFETIAGNTGFSSYLESARRARNELEQERRAGWRREVDASPACGHGERGGARVSPFTGEAMCPMCRRGVAVDDSPQLPPEVGAAVAAYGEAWGAAGNGPPPPPLLAQVLEQVQQAIGQGVSPAAVAQLARRAGAAGTDLFTIIRSETS